MIGYRIEPPYVVSCQMCGPVAIVETMHDGEAEMAIHYAAVHGRTGMIPRPAIVASILERELAEGLA